MKSKLYIMSLLVIIVLSSCTPAQEEKTSSEPPVTEMSDEITEYMKLPEISELTDCITQADPKSFTCYYKRGVYLKNKGYNEMALQDFKESAKVPLNRDDADKIRSESYWMSAIIHSKYGDKVLAKTFYTKAIRHKPSSMLYNNLALVCTDLEQYDEAMENFNKSLEMSDSNPYTYNNIAYMNIRSGELGNALLSLKMSEKMDDKNPYVYRNYALYHGAMNESEAACSAIEKASSLGFLEKASSVERTEFERLKMEHCK